MPFLHLFLLVLLVLSMWSGSARAYFLGLYPNPSSEPLVTLSFVDEPAGGRVDVFNSATGQWYGYLPLDTPTGARGRWKIALPGPGVLILRIQSAGGTVLYRRVVTRRAGTPVPGDPNTALRR